LFTVPEPSRFDQALIQGDDPIDINSELMLEETK
jgi:hypothetical protein